MANAPDAATQALAALPLLILLVAAPLAFVASLLLLGMFKRAVKRSMMRAVGAGVSERVVSSASTPAAALGMGDAAETARADPYLAAPGGVAYGLGGLAYALVAAWSSLTANMDGGALGLDVLAPFTLIHFWPALIAIGLASLTTWRGRLLLLGSYLALLCVVTAVALGAAKIGPILLAWLFVNALGTVLMLAFLARPIRAVGPLALVFMVALVGGANIIPAFIGGDTERLLWVAQLGAPLGLDPLPTYVALILLGAALMAVIGALLLLSIGWLYRAQLITDQTVLIDPLFFLFGLLLSMELVFEGPIWFFAGLAAFAAYKLISLAAFALIRAPTPATPPRLLLLRVFSLGKRSEQLFDAFGKLWRRRGSIRMIAGPDLVTSTVEPHEFMEFLQGKLARRFIDNDAAIDRRLAEGDEARRFDGRYGVVELFCHDDTWRLALRRLVRDSDAVLMDLRGFAPNNQGCVFEIEALLELAPLSRVVFVVDGTTDEAFLRQTFDAAWAKVSAESPNRGDAAARARLFRFSGADGARRLAAAVGTSA